MDRTFTSFLEIQCPIVCTSDARFRFRIRNRFRNYSIFGWNRNQNRNQENRIVLESEWNQEIFAGIGIGTGIRDLKNAGIGIGTGIKTYPESCITGVHLFIHLLVSFQQIKQIHGVCHASRYDDEIVMRSLFLLLMDLIHQCYQYLSSCV